LLSAQEYDSDKFLVALVRMQRLLGRVADAFPNPESDDSPLAMNGAVYMMISTAQKELDALVRGQPSEVQRNGKRSNIPLGLDTSTRAYIPYQY
jgi:hypothetical protein